MLLSKEGLQAKKSELENLRGKLYELGKYKGEVSIHSGDAWHDNNDFEQTEIEERRLHFQIATLEKEIKSATIVDNPASTDDTVDFNSTVKIKLTFDDGEIEIIESKFLDVSSNPGEVITIQSPLGKAIFHKKIGDKGNYTSPGGKVLFEILSIN